MCCCRKKKSLDVTYKGRHCTDIACLVLFAAAWFITVVVMIAAGKTADSAALSFGRDYNGDVCGSEITHPGAKSLGCDTETCQQVYYPKLSEDVSVSLLLNTTVSLFGICLPYCPSASDIVCTYNYTDNIGVPMYSEVIQCSNVVYRAANSELCSNCWVVPLNTTNVMNRCVPVVDTQTKTNKRCIVPDSPADPSDPDYVDPDSSACLAQSVEETTTQTKAAQNDVLTNALLSVQVFLQRYMSDIKSSYVVLFIGGVVSFALGYIFLFFVKSCSQCMVWTSIIVGLLLCAVVTLFMYYQADMIPLDKWFDFVVEKGDETFHWGNMTFESIVEEIPDYLLASDSTRDYWAIAAYVMTALTIILFFVVIALSSAVKTSTEIMKQASNALRHIPSVFFVPILTTIFNVAVFILVAYSYSLTLSSNLTLTDYTDEIMNTVGVEIPKNSTYMLCEDPKTMTNCTYISKAMEGNTGTDVVLAFWHLFVWFWSSGFVNAIGTMTIAGTVGKWYFKKTDDTTRIGFGTLIQTFACVCCYHLGSVAYGSFVIATIQLFRSIMLKFKEQQTKNPLVKCGFKCCHCCLACLEKCMKYLSRNAYILVITRGTNFFKSSVNSFGLLASNLATVSVLKSVSTLFIWMGKMSNIIISVLVVILMIYKCPSFLSHPILTPYAPAAIAFVLSYIISSTFIQVFIITMDTVMLCYCEDKKMHGQDSSEMEGRIGGNKQEVTAEVAQEGSEVVAQEGGQEGSQEGNAE